MASHGWPVMGIAFAGAGLGLFGATPEPILAPATRTPKLPKVENAHSSMRPVGDPRIPISFVAARETPFMTFGAFDFAPLLRPGLPPPAVKWTGLAKYSFIGGNNDAEQVPVDGLIAAATAVLEREGSTLATYGLASGPLGYGALREFLAAKLKRDAGISCSRDEILITSGSLQAIDLVNGVLLAQGDTVLIERETYQGALTRLARLGVKAVGIPLDRGGLRMDALSSALDDLKGRNIRPKYIYTIPTVQNPTGTIMGEERRRELLRLAQSHGVPIFEDDCYADLIWDGRRPPALYAMSRHGGVIHIGSFSKSIAPALRIGYIVAGWDVLSRMLALKTDAGSGALEQMVLAEYCTAHFTEHVPQLTRGLRTKLETLMESLAEQFGTAAEFDDPAGGIFLWIKLPEVVDTMKLAQSALAAGVAINPGPEWSTDKAYARSRMRLCFGSPTADEIRQGIATLADVCRREFGVPARIANVEQSRRTPAG
jgi:2-aminoadipate transaminase